MSYGNVDYQDALDDLLERYSSKKIDAGTFIELRSDLIERGLALLEREFALNMLTAKGLQVKADELRRAFTREMELAQVRSYVAIYLNVTFQD